LDIGEIAEVGAKFHVRDEGHLRVRWGNGWESVIEVKIWQNSATASARYEIQEILVGVHRMFLGFRKVVSDSADS
jgi:hypothetical protein